MKRYAEIGMILVTILWGASYVSGKLILDNMTPLYYTSIRFIGAAIFLGFVFHNRLKFLNKATLKAGLLIGLAVATGYILQTVGLNYTTASKTGFLTGLFVVLVPVIDSVIRRSKPRINEIIGVTLATIGLGVLSLNGDFSIAIGDILLVLSAISFAICIILISRYAKDHDPVLLTIIQVAVTAASSIIFAIIIEPPMVMRVFDKNLVLLLLFAILFGTAVNTIVQNWAQSKINATSASLILVLEPVFAGVFGFIFMGDPLGMKEISGSALIIAGMLFTLVIKPEKLPSEPINPASAGI
ncbi:MAG: DMT family transporter [Firmicutes bacterium]|nr:DMT family transporter [Bacillota bacterium]